MWKFSFGNYLAGIFGMTPSLVMPLIVINRLGPKATAYFYMPTMIINLLQAIPRATMASLFAESAHDGSSLKKQVLKALSLCSLILIPAIIILFIFGRNILLVFGKEYSQEGLMYLQLTALSVIFFIPNAMFGVMLNIKKQVRKILAINIISCTTTLILSILLISHGLFGLGLAGILAQIILIIINLIAYYKKIIF
jgi:O-antigen/teichoic acid export membrane protein